MASIDARTVPPDKPLEEIHVDIEERVKAAIDRLTFQAARRAGQEAPARAPRAFRRILVAVDGSPESARAVAWAKEMARMDDAPVEVLTVVAPPYVYDQAAGGVGWWAPVADAYRREQREAEDAVAAAVRELREAGVAAEGRAVTGSPVREIVAVAEAIRADLVVVGSHGRGAVGRLLLGSVADGVKNHSRASVLVARTSPPPRRVLVAVDGSEPSKAAAVIAARLAARLRVHATVAYVLDTLVRGQEPRDRSVLEQTVKELGLLEEKGPVSYLLDVGEPAQRIVELARSRECDLVVMGSRGLSGLRSLVAGSVSNRVAHHAEASVLLLKEGAP